MSLVGAPLGQAEDKWNAAPRLRFGLRYVLGVHMIGSCCGEFIASAAAMVELELCVDDVREIVFPHPTVSEALKEAILHA